MAKPLIMIVEDEKEYANEISEDVKSSDEFDTVIANSARDALEALAKNKVLFGLAGNRIQLILLDIKMPGMDGLQFLEQLRKSHNEAEIGVIMVTAFEDEEKWDKATSGFIVGYIRKPYDRENLLAMIRKFFSNPDARYKMILDTFEKHIEKREELKGQQGSEA